MQRYQLVSIRGVGLKFWKNLIWRMLGDSTLGESNWDEEGEG